MALKEDQAEEKIARMKELYMALGIKESATKAIMDYYGKAIDIISKVGFSAAQLQQLHLFADKLIKRIK